MSNTSESLSKYQRMREHIKNASGFKLATYFTGFVAIFILFAYIFSLFVPHSYDLEYREINKEVPLNFHSVRSGDYLRFIDNKVYYRDVCKVRLPENICNHATTLLNAKYIVVHDFCKKPMVKNFQYEKECLIVFTDAHFKLSSGEIIHYTSSKHSLNYASNSDMFALILGNTLIFYVWGLSSIWIIKRKKALLE